MNLVVHSNRDLELIVGVREIASPALGARARWLYKLVRNGMPKEI